MEQNLIPVQQNQPLSSSVAIKMSNDEDLQEPLIERLSASPDPETSEAPSKKRKRGVVENGAKKAAKKTKKAKIAEEDELDIEAGINNSFARMDSQLLADYVAQRTRRYESDLSSIELEDKFIPGMFDDELVTTYILMFMQPMP